VSLSTHAYSLTHADADADADADANADADADVDADADAEDAAMITRDNAVCVVLLASIRLFVSHHLLLLRVSL
jgi:predicted  nucleic acid-binding Zn-ribbon protein